MLASKNMNARSQLIFWDKINLKNKSDVTWLFNWCKNKPTIFLNIIHGTIQLLTESNESDSVIFSLKEFMDLEFKSWLCICEHEYLKLMKVTLFEKVMDHNMIYDHNIFVCQELIYSGMLRINIAILKLFIDDRNSFTIEERKSLGLYQTVKANVNEHQIISRHSDKVKTDALDMIVNITQGNDQTIFNAPSAQSMPNILNRYHNNNQFILKLKFKNMNEKIKWAQEL